MKSEHRNSEKSLMNTLNSQHDNISVDAFVDVAKLGNRNSIQRQVLKARLVMDSVFARLSMRVTNNSITGPVMISGRRDSVLLPLLYGRRTLKIQ